MELVKFLFGEVQSSEVTVLSVHDLTSHSVLSCGTIGWITTSVLTGHRDGTVSSWQSHNDCREA